MIEAQHSQRAAVGGLSRGFRHGGNHCRQHDRCQQESNQFLHLEITSLFDPLLRFLLRRSAGAYVQALFTKAPNILLCFLPSGLGRPNLFARGVHTRAMHTLLHVAVSGQVSRGDNQPFGIHRDASLFLSISCASCTGNDQIKTDGTPPCVRHPRHAAEAFLPCSAGCTWDSGYGTGSRKAASEYWAPRPAR